MQWTPTNSIVSSVDRENHTIHLVVNDCHVTAICTPQDNIHIYEELKAILVHSVIKSLDKWKI